MTNTTDKITDPALNLRIHRDLRRILEKITTPEQLQELITVWNNIYLEYAEVFGALSIMYNGLINNTASQSDEVSFQLNSNQITIRGRGMSVFESDYNLAALNQIINSFIEDTYAKFAVFLKGLDIVESEFDELSQLLYPLVSIREWLTYEDQKTYVDVFGTAINQTAYNRGVLEQSEDTLRMINSYLGLS